MGRRAIVRRMAGMSGVGGRHASGEGEGKCTWQLVGAVGELAWVGDECCQDPSLGNLSQKCGYHSFEKAGGKNSLARGGRA